MDIKEIYNIQAKRHPWETSRLKAIQKILHPVLFEGIKVLDVGCGDGFVSRGLFNGMNSKVVTAVDINLSDELMDYLSNLTKWITYSRKVPVKESFDLVLLLDVIEHVEHDRAFLKGVTENNVTDNGMVLITVPAYQSIFSRHDIFLGHYRRYNLPELVDLTNSCGLKLLSSGYLFFSLLLPKVILYKLYNTDKPIVGVGNWNGGKILTIILNMILNIDNCILIIASKFGFKIPGLTGWVLCKKRE